MECKAKKEMKVHHLFRMKKPFPWDWLTLFLQRIQKDVRHCGAMLESGGRGWKNHKFKAILKYLV